MAIYGTALVLEIFGEVIAEGGAGVVIGSQSSHRLPPLREEDLRDLATTPTEALLTLPIVQEINDSLRAYQIAKKANALRVQMEAVRWGRRGARVNCISPGIIYSGYMARRHSAKLSVEGYTHRWRWMS